MTYNNKELDYKEWRCMVSHGHGVDLQYSIKAKVWSPIEGPDGRWQQL
jgi:hypothetical protein